MADHTVWQPRLDAVRQVVIDEACAGRSPTLIPPGIWGRLERCLTENPETWNWFQRFRDAGLIAPEKD